MDTAEPRTVEAVGFDLDYTLAVPERDRTAILVDALAAVGVAPGTVAAPREAYLDAHRRHLDGDTRAPVFATMLSAADVPVVGAADSLSAPDAVDPAAAARAYREGIAAALELVPGVRELLGDLRERYRVGLLTDGPALAQRDKLDALGLGDAFEAVLVSGELGVGKPDRRAFAALAAALGVTPARAVYVGDEPEIDVVGAAEAGFRTVQVLGPDERAHPRSDAAVAREDLAARLPAVLADLAGDSP
jgi:putative hydrolase of the HAD superfamily